MRIRSFAPRRAAVVCFGAALLGACGPTDPDKATIEVAFVEPADGATGVALDARVRVGFSGDVDEDTLAAGLSISPAVDGSVRWDSAALVATFTPDAAWSPETAYTVTIDGIVGAAGEALAAPVTSGFTTGLGGDDPLPNEDDSGSWMFDGDTVTVSATGPFDARTYTLHSTQPLRDGPANGEVVVIETAEQPVLRSGNLLLDALFAMAVQESRQLSVNAIMDGAFANGNAMPCECFQTGELWRYVWTRDTAYAAHLGMAWLDPDRARNSLQFKLSQRKGGGDYQIVQDTGTGGSWPVSTDRVVWALGAWRTWLWLDDASRQAFGELAYTAMVNTANQDRIHVYDPVDGLFRGEQSFLDWREQTYPSWTATDVVHIAGGKSLSTNLAHHQLRVALAELGAVRGEPDAAKWQQEADDLAEAIRRRFWLDDADQFSTRIPGPMDDAPVRQYDWLGTSLAVISGVATPEQAKAAVGSYPHGPHGPPVIWPQQPLTPIYHNRAIWPFVTAYGLLAAREADHPGAFTAGFDSLVRGAALNLSHQENLEVLDGVPWKDDGANSGPVVNSRRQLWSVGGFIGAFVHGVFGAEPTVDGLTFRPYIAGAVRDRWFPQATTVRLLRFPYRGETFDVALTLPAGAGAASLTGGDGVARTAAELADGVELSLSAGGSAAAVVAIGDVADYRNVWSPREVTIVSAARQGDREVALSWTSTDDTALFAVYRDGQRIADTVTSTSFVDPDAHPGDHAPCYAVEPYFPTGTHGQRSKPVCLWGGGPNRIQDLRPHDFELILGGRWASNHFRDHIAGFGAPGDALVAAAVVPEWTGRHLIELQVGNAMGPISTGITAGHLRLTVREAETGAVVAEGSVVAPHRLNWDDWGTSTLVAADLVAGRSYEITIEDAPNMSAWSHFEAYTGGNGGGRSVTNSVNLSGVRLMALDGDYDPRVATIAFDGQGDLDAVPGGDVRTPGAPVTPDSKVAVSWDDDYLYLVLRSMAFTDAWKPWMVYLEVGDALGDPVAGTGMAYSGLTPTLPFSPTHAVTFRNTSDDGLGSGPFNGLYRAAGGWVAQQRWAPYRDAWLSADPRTGSIRVPWAALGDPAQVRLAAHVVNAAPANEWKELWPADHAPWDDGGGFLTITR
jgi:hypothetical protein